MADLSPVQQFTDITGADEATANFFLSAAHNNLDAAVSTYFESGGIIPPASEAPRPSRPSAAPRPTSLPTQPPVGAPSSFNPVDPAAAPSSNTPVPPPAQRRPARCTGVATLGSLARERDDDEKGYYAGGEKSGQMIQDPRQRPDADATGPPQSPSSSDAPPSGPAGLADAIFERARERGPRTDAEVEQFDGPQRFSGAGYRLGQDAQDAPARPSVVGRRHATRVLTFYANGFRVDEGPLRAFDDPANEAFLADVNRGFVPKEMEDPGIGEVSIALVDRKGEDYVEKRRSIVPFSGGGQRLSEDDGNTGAAAAASSASTSSVPASAPVDANAANAVLTVDESRAVGRVQIRLSDGTRLVARLNEDATVGQLREFVRASRPGSTNFVLSTTFPKKVLDDDSKTIKEAQLLGAVVVQTLK